MKSDRQLGRGGGESSSPECLTGAQPPAIDSGVICWRFVRLLTEPPPQAALLIVIDDAEAAIENNFSSLLTE